MIKLHIQNISLPLRLTVMDLILLAAFTFFIVVTLVINYFRHSKVFLIDFACYKAPDSQKCCKEKIMSIAKNTYGVHENIQAMISLGLERSGTGDETYVPEGVLESTPNTSLVLARKEAKDAMTGAIDQLLAKTGVSTKDIAIVITNCTLLTAPPSLSALIVNKYKLREGVITYNLTGMGCSAGIIAINLAQQLLKVHPNSYALVYSTENLTQDVYIGEVLAMQLANALFRIGGAAMLLSNRPSARRIAKYQLLHTVLTNTAAYDKSYNCISREEDDQGNLGIKISKDLMPVAIKAIEANLSALAILILPLSEKIRFVTTFLIRYLKLAKIKPYVPRFKTVLDHVYPHVGGRAVLDGLEKKLGFTENDLEPSRMTLYRFGNTSSSSIWYALAYAEAKKRIKRGDRLWQLAFGSGFKCNSMIWCALKTIDLEENNPWTQEINQFPVKLKDIAPETYLEAVE